MINIPEQPACVYCGGGANLFDAAGSHPYVPDHGPFRIFRCGQCGSLFTHPNPSIEVMARFYSGYQKGMYHKVSMLRERFPLNAWFNQCLRRIQRVFPDPEARFKWMDIGAGDGIMSAWMERAYPKSEGIAVDFHKRPSRLAASGVRWIEADLNKDLHGLPPVDLVFSITVLEHVLDPRDFVDGMLGLLLPGGSLYLNCPRTDSLAFRLLGKRWPYYLPGEHITIPTIKGLQHLVDSCCRSRFGRSGQLSVKPVIMPYPLGYYLGYYLGWNAKRYWIDPDIYLPTGLLECMLQLGSAIDLPVNNEQGSFLDLPEQGGQVFANKPQHNELDTSDEHHGGDDGSPSGDSLTSEVGGD